MLLLGVPIPGPWREAARGLSIILEELMLDIMYQIPSLPDLKELVISREVVERRVQPLPVVRKVS